MRYRRPLTFMVGALAFLTSILQAQESTPNPSADLAVRSHNAEIRLVADGFGFTEGPVANSAGVLYFTDQPNDRIMSWSENLGLSTYLTPSGRSNGLALDAQGRLLACADNLNQLWQVSSGGEVDVLVKDYKGKLLNGPNDLWVDPKGGVYFTDPYYQRPYWTRGPMEQEGSNVFYLTPSRSELKMVAFGLNRPNGISGTPDGKVLYVSDLGENKTYAYSIEPGGALTDRRLFASKGSDGMTLDERGNLYMTGEGVSVFSPSGEQIDLISIEKRTSNVCFGGPDRRTLFITAQDSLYSLPMHVSGAIVHSDIPFHEMPAAGLQVPMRFVDKDDPNISCDYLLFLPKDYEHSDREWPLMLFLHGRGESRGPLELVKKWGPPKRAEGDAEFPYVLVSPQCPADDHWSSKKQTEVLSRLLDHVSRVHPIDPQRIYLTGLSMGGYGSWTLAAKEPHRFAAVAPICGGADPSLAHSLKDLPIWAWHGLDDRVVPSRGSQQIVDALINLGSTHIRYTTLECIGHVSWAAAYASPELYSWFDQQSRKPDQHTQDR